MYQVSFITKNSFAPTLFVYTDTDLTVDGAEKAFHAFRERFGPEIVIVLRNDHWFLDWDDYPIYNPFVPQKGEPPSTQEYSATRSIVCHAVKDGAGRSGCYVKRGLQ